MVLFDLSEAFGREIDLDHKRCPTLLMQRAGIRLRRRTVTNRGLSAINSVDQTQVILLSMDVLGQNDQKSAIVLENSPFDDRQDAGKRLAAALPELDASKTVVVALPRGGVPVAEEICKARNLPLDLVFVRKIGVPGQPEVAVGAIVDGTHPNVIVNEWIARGAGLSDATVQKMGRDLLPEIERRKAHYLGAIKRPDLKGKTLIVVDDGVATGATLKASLQALRESVGTRVILALPTAPTDVLSSLAEYADEIICLYIPVHFYAVGAAYRHFPQISDDEVVEALKRCAGYAHEENT